MSRQYDFTDDLALERINKDEQQKKFRQSRVLRGKNAAALIGKCSLEDGTILIEKNNKESEFLTLDVLYDLKQKGKIAELNAVVEAASAKTQLDGLTPIFMTPTVKSEYNILKDDIEDMELCLCKLDKQYEMHDNFWHSILTDKLFKDSKKHKQNYGMVSDYYSIPTDKRPFLKNSELTQPKSGEHLYNVHQHIAQFLPDNKKAILAYVDLIERKKRLFDIGRLDMRFDPKHKKALEKHLCLVPAYKKNGKQYYRPNRNRADLMNFLAGSGLIVSFFDKSESILKQVVGYVLKYVLKSTNAHTSASSFEDKLNDFAYRSKAVFSKLGRRPFSYSRKYTFKLTDYRKLCSKAIKYDPRFKRLAYWTELKDKGLLRVKPFYEDPENTKKITRLELWLTLYVDGVPIEQLISDWDSDQYELVKTDDVYHSVVTRYALEQMASA